MQVAAAAHGQSPPARQVHEALPVGGRVGTVLRLDAVHPEGGQLVDKGLQAVAGQAVAERVGEEHGASRLVREANGLGGGERRRTRRAGADPLYRVHQPAHALVAARALGSKGGGKGGVVRVDPVREQVHLAPGRPRGDLHPVDAAHVPPGQGLAELCRPFAGVVVCERGPGDPVVGEHAGEVLGQEGAVAQGGVGVEVDPDRRAGHGPGRSYPNRGPFPSRGTILDSVGKIWIYRVVDRSFERRRWCMLHEPAAKTGKDPAFAYKRRLGVIMFAVYGVIYAGFVAVNLASPVAMEVVLFGGLDLAVVYGMGLIVIALVLALLYNRACGRREAAMSGGKGEKKA